MSHLILVSVLIINVPKGNILRYAIIIHPFQIHTIEYEEKKVKLVSKT